MWYIVKKETTSPSPRSLDEIVFTGRNKAYGAYLLRKEYERTLIRALIIVSTGVVLMTVTGWVFSRTTSVVTIDTSQVPTVITTTPVNLEPLPEKTPERSSPLQKKPEPPATSNNAAKIYTVASEDNDKTDSVMTDLNPTLPLVMPGAEGNTNTGTITGTNNAGPVTEKVRTFEPWDPNIQRPEFDGGLEALMRFVSNNIRYPRELAELGIGGKVLVRFVVDEKGRVSEVTIKGSTHSGFNEESVRVIRMLPDFKSPGKMDGRAVKVFYELPIKFQTN